MVGRVGPGCTDYELHLRADPVHHLLVLRHEHQVPNALVYNMMQKHTKHHALVNSATPVAFATLTVKSEVLGEGLRGEQLELFGNEIAQALCVRIQVAGREALIRAVEEREQVVFLSEKIHFKMSCLWKDKGGLGLKGLLE